MIVVHLQHLVIMDSLILLLLVLLCTVVTSYIQEVVIDGNFIVHNTSLRFLSITLDTSLVAHRFKEGSFSLRNRNVIAMAKALSPAYLRLGGTSSDYIIYNMTMTTSIYNDLPILSQRHDMILTSKLFHSIAEFALLTNLSFVFGLNALRRNNASQWQSNNSMSLIDFAVKNNIQLNAVELGNEPDLYAKHNMTALSPQQLARDFEYLRSILPKHIHLIGPDTAGVHFSSGFFFEFVSLLHPNITTAITWHHYYIDGRTATLSDFIDISLFDSFIKLLNTTIDIVAKYQRDNQLWLGETSTAYGGGAPGISDRYIASFMWLDKLGLAARLGHSVVCRQALFGGHYSLIGDDALPNPDFFISVLFKRLVSTRVLAIHGELTGRTLREYAWCERNSETGGVVLLLINVTRENVTVAVTVTGAHVINGDRAEYHFSAGNDDMLSRTIKLNGVLLNLNTDGSVPNMLGQWSRGGSDVIISPFSSVFVVMPYIKAPACM